MKDYYRIIGQADPLDDKEEVDGDFEEERKEENKDLNVRDDRYIEGRNDSEVGGGEDREVDETMTIVIYKYPTQVKGGPRGIKKLKDAAENTIAGENVALLNEGNAVADEEEGLDFGAFVEDKW